MGQGFVLSREVLPPSDLFDEYLSYGAAASGTGWIAGIGLVRSLRQRKFDSLIYLVPRNRSTAQVKRDLAFFRLCGIKQFAGHTGFEELDPVNRPLPFVTPETDHLLHRLKLSGISTNTPRMDLRLTASEHTSAETWLNRNIPDLVGQTLVAFGPTSKWPSKIWPLERYQELGKRLIQRYNIIPIVMGSAGERQIGQTLIDGWGTGVNAAGSLSIRQSAAVLKRCVMYIGNDTGIMHLASAVETRCVAVFSAQDWPGRWYPNGHGHFILRESVPCEGCMLRECNKDLICLTAITVDMVASACAAVLQPIICNMRAPESSLI